MDDRDILCPTKVERKILADIIRQLATCGVVNFAETARELGMDPRRRDEIRRTYLRFRDANIAFDDMCLHFERANALTGGTLALDVKASTTGILTQRLTFAQTHQAAAVGVHETKDKVAYWLDVWAQQEDQYRGAKAALDAKLTTEKRLVSHEKGGRKDPRDIVGSGRWRRWETELDGPGHNDDPIPRIDPSTAVMKNWCRTGGRVWRVGLDDYKDEYDGEARIGETARDDTDESQSRANWAAARQRESEKNALIIEDEKDQEPESGALKIE